MCQGSVVSQQCVCVLCVWPAHPWSVQNTAGLLTAFWSSCNCGGGLSRWSSGACLLVWLSVEKPSLSRSTCAGGVCNGKCTDNWPPGASLLQHEKPSHRCGGHRSRKLCPVKRASWEEDVTVKTCNPNENQIQSAHFLWNFCGRKPIAHQHVPYSY